MSETPAETDPLEAVQPARLAFLRRGIRLRGGSIRRHAARGTMINAAFSVGVALIALVRGLVVARFLTLADYGVWGVLIASVGTIFVLKQIGVGDKYIQQEGEDQELAYQKAFSVECVVHAVFLVLLLIAVPAIAAVYGRGELILPGLSLALLLPAGLLQTSTWVFYREMNFAKLRALQIIDPILGSITALALAVAGAGYWSLMAGAIVGAWATALLSLRASPYRLRFRFELDTLRSYMSFSWPLFVTSISGLSVMQASAFFGTKATGLAGTGAITLSATIGQFAQRVDDVVSTTMYPLVCAVQHRRDLLYESFVKSNRVALLWAVPFGLGMSLFAADMVHFGIGEQWHAAIPLFITFGITAALGHLGFNWDDYFRATSNTRPIAWAAAIAAAGFLATAIPLVYLWGLKGFAVGVLVQVVVHMVCRVYFLRRLFDGFDMLRHAARAIAPTVPAVAAVLALRALEPGRRTLGLVLVELVIYGLVTVVASWGLERRLLIEMVGYLRRSAAAADEPENRPARPGDEDVEAVLPAQR